MLLQDHKTRPAMIIHLAVIILMLATLGAFLILWYFWVKKKVEASFFLDDEEQVLFPFRYFSWIFIGLVVLTCLAQVHFLRVSAAVHERLAQVAGFHKSQQSCAGAVDELKVMMQGVRKDVNAGFTRLAANAARPPALAETLDRPTRFDDAPATAPAKTPLRDDLPLGLPKVGKADTASSFAQEARASASEDAVDDRPLEGDTEPKDPAKGVWSMALNMEGKVTTDSLRVRKEPDKSARVVAKLKAGDQVKVTEKRIVDDGMWFRVITPNGRAGWVDFRFLKLQALAQPAQGA